jgi:uncharacterized protein YndB with AHSA1/START domain
MKFLKWLLISLVVLLGLVFVVSYLLPKEYYVERTKTINAPAMVVYQQVVDLEAWQTWNPWNELDPEMTISYGEIKVGTGASYSWQSEKAGNGTMRITETVPPSNARYELIFEGFEDNPSISEFKLEGENLAGPTTVTWTFEGDVGDKLFARWMVILMDKMVGASYEQGLASLKAQCEG